MKEWTNHFKTLLNDGWIEKDILRDTFGKQGISFTSYQIELFFFSFTDDLFPISFSGERNQLNTLHNQPNELVYTKLK